MTTQTEPASRFSISAILWFSLLGLAMLWSFWTTLGAIAGRWAEDPQYSHGYLVPAFAAYLLWLRKNLLVKLTFSANYLGLLLMTAALALRLAGTHYHYDYFSQISILPCLAGMFLLMGSWPVLRWSMPAVTFLAFMIPLPHSVSLAMAGPMQSFATMVSTFLLQVCGRPALAEGNVILLNDIELGIVEACSGLRMLVVFFALSTAVSMLIRKPLWEKLFMASSAIPIALISNILRITITGLFYDSFGNHFGGPFFHDLAGWLMMPLGLAFLGIELWVLRTLLPESITSTLRTNPLPLPRVDNHPVALYRARTAARRENAAASVTLATVMAAHQPDHAAPPVAAEVVADEEPVAQGS